MTNRNKDKGKSFERMVCVMFSEATGLSFQRVPSSGAFIGGSNFHRIKALSDSQVLIHRGDIIPPDELPNLVIECKARKDFPFHRLLNSSKELDDWIEQSREYIQDCVLLTIFKINLRGMYVCTDRVSLIEKKRNFINYQYGGILFYIQSFDIDWIKSSREELEILSKRRVDA